LKNQKKLKNQNQKKLKNQKKKVEEPKPETVVEPKEPPKKEKETEKNEEIKELKKVEIKEEYIPIPEPEVKIVEKEVPKKGTKKEEKKNLDSSVHKESEGFVLVDSLHSSSPNKLYLPSNKTSFEHFLPLLAAKFFDVKYESFILTDGDIQGELFQEKNVSKRPSFLITSEKEKDGIWIWDLHSIIRYFSEMKKDSVFNYQVDCWIDYLNNNLLKCHLKDKPDYAAMEVVIKFLEEIVTKGSLLENTSFADVYGVSLLWYAFRDNFAPEFCQKYPNVVNWVKKVSSEKNFCLVFGDLKFKEGKKKHHKELILLNGNKFIKIKKMFYLISGVKIIWMK